MDLGVRRRPNFNQAMICVLWFSADRVWLVSTFSYFYIFVYYFLNFNLINIQCRTNSLHNLPSDSGAKRIAHIDCRPNSVCRTPLICVYSD